MTTVAGTVTMYFRFIGGAALFFSFLGYSRRTGKENHDWAAGLMALECWRWFRWTAGVGAILAAIDAILIHFRWAWWI